MGKGTGIKFVNDKWYGAYAWHHIAHPPKDLLTDRCFDTYEKAIEYAASYLCDDDDINAFYYSDNRWWKLIPENSKRDKIMEIKIYVDFEGQEVLTEKGFEERKKIVIQDLVDEKVFLAEFLEGKFDHVADLFYDLENEVTTTDQLLEEYKEWIKDRIKSDNPKFLIDLDDFDEFILEV